MMEDYGYCSKTGVCFNPFGVKPEWVQKRAHKIRHGLLIEQTEEAFVLTDKITKDGVACIDLNYYWRPIEEAPHGVKLQLLSVYGVASHGSLSPAIIEDGFWIGWTPLPRRRK